MKIAFYFGYVSLVPLVQCRGSEITAVHLIRALSAFGLDITVFHSHHDDTTEHNIPMRHTSKFDSSQFDVVVVSRYIHIFMEHHIVDTCTVVLWLHDVLLQPYWRNKCIPGNGGFLLYNVFSKLSAIVTLSDWHTQNIANFYKTYVPPETLQHNVVEIGHGITPHTSQTQKDPLSFGMQIRPCVSPCVHIKRQQGAASGALVYAPNICQVQQRIIDVLWHH